MLTQSEADTLIAMGKSFTNPTTIFLPPGADQTHELIGTDERERFLLDLWRGTIQHTFEDFCNYCNIGGIPPFQESLL